MTGAVYRQSGEFFVTLMRGAEQIDIAGPFDEAAEAVEMAKRWTPCVTVDCAVGESGDRCRYDITHTDDFWLLA